MHRVDRLVMLAAFVALGIYRLIRYTKAATTKGSRPAVPPTAGVATPVDPVAAPGTWGPVPGSGRSARATLAAVLVWALGNAVLWLCLFGLPAFDSVPVIWRLVGGVLVSFYLVVLARGVAARLRRRSGPGAQMTGGNPFPDS
jgi:hypothetical protein